MHNLSHNTVGMIALIRVPSLAIGDCELTYLQRTSIDHKVATEQHANYVEALRRLGLSVINLPATPELPDSTFVEDTAVVLDEVAVMTSPCTPRKREIDSVHQVLSRYRKIATIATNAKLEGGDVIRDGRTLYVGQSTRTNPHGLESLRAALSRYGYSIVPIEVPHCLHLSTAISCLDHETFLINSDWIDPCSFAGKRLIEVPREEPWAANVLSINGCIVVPSEFPRTADLLAKLGYSACAVDVSELLKAEAGVTCMSLIFRASSSEEPVQTESQDGGRAFAMCD
jgi:dimethylargininase